MIVRTLIATAVAMLLAACGQRGPLFLPDEAPVEVRQTSGRTPAPEASEPAPTEEPAPKPDESQEKEKTGTEAGKPR